MQFALSFLFAMIVALLPKKKRKYALNLPSKKNNLVIKDDIRDKLRPLTKSLPCMNEMFVNKNLSKLT